MGCKNTNILLGVKTTYYKKCKDVYRNGTNSVTWAYKYVKVVKSFNVDQTN